MILIPQPRLVLRATGRNVHKTIPRMSILELAASSQRGSLLHNRNVIPASQRGEGREHYEVAAGGRRLAALRLMAKKHRIGKGCREVEVDYRDERMTAIGTAPRPFPLGAMNFKIRARRWPRIGAGPMPAHRWVN